MQTNAPPCCGSCSISPNNGTSLTTTFTVTCSNWKVSFGAPTYNVKIRHDSQLEDDTTLLSFGVSPVSEVVIPAGKKDDDYEVLIEVIVQDIYEANVHVHLPKIKVFFIFISFGFTSMQC